MAIYHFSAQVIGRSSGRSSVAAAAYRHAERLVDERTGLTHDYTAKRGVVEVVVLAPSNAPSWVQGPRLWQEVEASETRKNSQTAREINVALPVELSHDQRRALLLDYCQEQFVVAGMVADVSFHEPDSQNPHAHIMLTTREIGPEGFGQKNRDWNKREVLETWREQWATHTNRALERAGQEARIDHRSIESQQLTAMLDDRMGDAIRLNHSATRHHGNRPSSTAHAHNAEALAEKQAAAAQWEKIHAEEIAQQQERARRERRADQSPTPEEARAPVSDREEERVWRGQVKAKAEQRKHEHEAARVAVEQARSSHEEAAARFKDKHAASEAAKRARAQARAKRQDAQKHLEQHKKRLTVRMGFGKSKTAALTGDLAKRKREEQRARKQRDTAAVECAEARDTTFARFLDHQQAEQRERAAAEAARVAGKNWEAVESGRYRWEQEQRKQAEQAARAATVATPKPKAPQTAIAAPEAPQARRVMEPPRPKPPRL